MVAIYGKFQSFDFDFTVIVRPSPVTIEKDFPIHPAWNADSMEALLFLV